MYVKGILAPSNAHVYTYHLWLLHGTVAELAIGTETLCPQSLKSLFRAPFQKSVLSPGLEHFRSPLQAQANSLPLLQALQPTLCSAGSLAHPCRTTGFPHSQKPGSLRIVQIS